MKEHWFPILLFVIVAIVIANEGITGYQKNSAENKTFAAYLAAERVDTFWHGADTSQIPVNADGKLIWYGHDLIAHTSYYFGPKGTVSRSANGMNCQNCHLNGGTIPFGNNFGKVYATYPQFRARNNGIQSIYGRVNDCFERSLNGMALDSTSHEMSAIYAYIKWLGEGIPKGTARGGTSIMKLNYLDRATDTTSGKQLYLSKCQSCHGGNGQGQPNGDATGYIYPPLWGNNSYNDGAGLYRISSFAGFVKNNMPFGANFHEPKLTDEEAWDVAAFVNSRPRPRKDQRSDWKDLAKKPVDFPYGPYKDSFTEIQHKYGPYLPIINSQKSINKKS